MSGFIVTEEAMRPARDAQECFYCRQVIGAEHKSDCVLINKKVKVRMTVEYEIEVPAAWGANMIEFHRNEGSWCSDNAIRELKELSTDNNCICGVTEFKYLGSDSAPYLDES